MYEDKDLIEQLVERTLTTESELQAAEYSSVEEKRDALATLQHAGLTTEQLQLLLKARFSRFRQNDWFRVMVLATAITKGTTTVSKLHGVLRDREYWARLHNQSTHFQTESLPDLGEINNCMGIPS